MASRYWVGGTGTWDASSTTHWSASSGGAGGASVPTATDDVIFNSASGGGTVTVSGIRSCLSFTTTGFTGGFTGSGAQITVGTNVVLGSSMSGSTFPTSGTVELKVGTNGTTCAITFNGKKVNVFSTGGLGGTTNFQDNVLAGSLSLSNRTVNANNHNVTADSVSLSGSSGANQLTLNMGSGTWLVGGASGGTLWDASGSNININAGTSLLRIVFSGAGNKNFNTEGGAFTFYDFEYANSGGGNLIIHGFPTFRNFTISGQPCTVSFRSSRTFTFTGTFDAVGAPGSLITLRSNSLSGGQATLVKASGDVECDYCDIRDLNATGGANWIPGANSIDSGNNDGWLFPETGKHRMFLVM